MSKLNKTQLNSLVATTVADTINSHTDLFKKDKAAEMIEIMTAALATHLAPKQGGGTSTKIDADGKVFCNYFEMYLDASGFNTKLGKPNKTTGERIEGYKANSITAEQILRKIKTVRNATTNQIVANYRDGTFTSEEMDELLAKTDTMLAEHFDIPEDVPVLSDIIQVFETK